MIERSHMDRESIWSRLSWPQVAALGIVIAGAVLTAVFAPIPWDRLPWEAIIGALLSTGGVIGLATGGPAVRPKRSSEPPSRIARAGAADVTRRDGSSSVQLLGWLAAWAIAAIIAVACSGCGASAIRMQASAATVATVVLEGAHRVATVATAERMAACDDDACTHDVEADMAPVVLTYDAARATLAGWIEALEVAAIASDDGAVLDALITAASRWLAQWSDLARALAGVGVDVPDLPPLLAGLAGGAR